MVASDQTQDDDVVFFSLIVVNCDYFYISNGVFTLRERFGDGLFDSEKLTCVERKNCDLIRFVVLLQQVRRESDNHIGFKRVCLCLKIGDLILWEFMVEKDVTFVVDTSYFWVRVDHWIVF